MTWKRVATAAVLIPVCRGDCFVGSTALLALVDGAGDFALALFEYFALGEAIGHRAYRFWTGTCAWPRFYATGTHPLQGRAADGSVWSTRLKLADCGGHANGGRRSFFTFLTGYKLC